MTTSCSFCCLPAERIWIQDDRTVVFLDGYPISRGHTLVIPRRHVSTLFDLSGDEQLYLWAKVATVRSLLVEQFHPDGFNIGINDGDTAGQTISHAHIHLIPRYRGDVADPRGGIRWVIPSRAKYW
jgi:diadenosine tetraphosphate (Ap4A) HIT family hydrolase